MIYLRRSKEFCLTFSADDLGIMKWWVEGECALHPDMRNNIGGMLSIVENTIHGDSIKQNRIKKLYIVRPSIAGK
jgi:hypothetical protein